MDESQITDKDRPKWLKATFSKTLVPFHGLLFLTILGMMIFRIITGGNN